MTTYNRVADLNNVLTKSKQKLKEINELIELAYRTADFQGVVTEYCHSLSITLNAVQYIAVLTIEVERLNIRIANIEKTMVAIEEVLDENL